MAFVREYCLILFLLMEHEVDPVSVLIETFRRQETCILASDSCSGHLEIY